MDLNEFTGSLLQNEPPAGLDVFLRSLWLDAKGDWQQAHELVNDLAGKKAAWLHAYLHRKEGDEWNAQYWYNRAGKKMPVVSLEEEWKEIAGAFIDMKD